MCQHGAPLQGRRVNEAAKLQARLAQPNAANAMMNPSKPPPGSSISRLTAAVQARQAARRAANAAMTTGLARPSVLQEPMANAVQLSNSAQSLQQTALVCVSPAAAAASGAHSFDHTGNSGYAGACAAAKGQQRPGTCQHSSPDAFAKWQPTLSGCSSQRGLARVDCTFSRRPECDAGLQQEDATAFKPPDDLGVQSSMGGVALTNGIGQSQQAHLLADKSNSNTRLSAYRYALSFAYLLSCKMLHADQVASLALHCVR